MSNAIFPSLPGLSWSVVKSPQWSTRSQKAISGRELRAAFYSSPLWTFKLSYEVLRAGAERELQQIVGFFNARQGMFDSFLYVDPTDNAVVAAPFGVGDGITTAFRLTRAIGAFSEPVAAVQNGASIRVNGQVTGCTVDLMSATVNFAVPPAAGSALTWTGAFYYRVRFLHDSVDFDNFMKDLWQAKKVEFISVK